MDGDLDKGLNFETRWINFEVKFLLEKILFPR